MNVQGMTSLRMRRHGALRAGMDRARRLARAPWAAFPTTVGLARLLPGPAYARLGRLDEAAARHRRVEARHRKVEQ